MLLLRLPLPRPLLARSWRSPRTYLAVLSLPACLSAGSLACAKSDTPQLASVETVQSDAFAGPAFELAEVRTEGAARIDRSSRAAAKLAPAGAAADAPSDYGELAQADNSSLDAASESDGAVAAIAKDSEPEHSRFIIYTASMSLAVFDLEKARGEAEAIPERYGGYLQSMQSGMLVMRIPAPSLRQAMDELGQLGVVEERQLRAQDVSEEYVDLESRIRVLRETQDQLVDLLKRAHTVEEALKVRQSLDQVTMELEQAMGRLRYLQGQVGFSTLTIQLMERGPHEPTPTSNDPFPWVDGLGVEATEWRN